jgi:hypothetical protein
MAGGVVRDSRRTRRENAWFLKVATWDEDVENGSHQTASARQCFKKSREKMEGNKKKRRQKNAAPQYSHVVPDHTTDWAVR